MDDAEVDAMERKVIIPTLVREDVMKARRIVPRVSNCECIVGKEQARS